MYTYQIKHPTTGEVLATATSETELPDGAYVLEADPGNSGNGGGGGPVIPA